MTKHINLQKNYSENSSGYQLKLPLNIETIIPENDSVRLLSQFVEEMDLTDLYSTYERINSLSPRTLLKIVLYSYMNGDYSSRSMELNCKRDHIYPVALGGADSEENWATTSMLHNSIKNNWTLEQLNWKLYDAGNYEEWDGLTGLFIELVNADTTLLEDSYIKKWYRLSC